MSGAGLVRFGARQRFRADAEWFVVGQHQGACSVCVGATAERTVDLMQSLAVHLDPAVDMAVADARSGRRWQGTLLALPDVRDALGRLRLLLSSYGGVELSVYTPGDQLTLTAAMVLVIYARTDRWAYLLDGAGLEERPAMPRPSWRPSVTPRFAVPNLEAALEAAANRLGLTELGA